ncbi:hypothetical protein BSPWISOXPB_11379 [uncultured Gammaproteobacteria bacterium]|nr:hypothetical protein BSPWISOXPB_11379 [uncultured Gammaproteobacteria bacterium]
MFVVINKRYFSNFITNGVIVGFMPTTRITTDKHTIDTAIFKIKP